MILRPESFEATVEPVVPCNRPPSLVGVPRYNLNYGGEAGRPDPVVWSYASLLMAGDPVESAKAPWYDGPCPKFVGLDA